MPAISWKACFPIVLPDGLPAPWGHFDKCALTNLYTHGPRRYYFAAVRCNCVCHRMSVTPQDAHRADVVFRRYMYGPFLVLALVFLAIFFAPAFI